MKFRLVEDLSKTQLESLMKNWQKYLQYLMTLSETELLKELELPTTNRISLKSPMFITSQGYIINARDFFQAPEMSIHLGIILKKFLKRYDLTPDDFFELAEYDDTTVDMQHSGYETIGQFIYNHNWIKINSGTEMDKGNAYIQLPRSNINYAQHSVLKDFIYTLSEEKSQVEVQAFNEKYVVSYNLKEVDAEYIMDRIDCYYRTGILLEKINKEN